MHERGRITAMLGEPHDAVLWAPNHRNWTAEDTNETNEANVNEYKLLAKFEQGMKAADVNKTRGATKIMQCDQVVFARIKKTLWTDQSHA